MIQEQAMKWDPEPSFSMLLFNVSLKNALQEEISD